MAEKVQGSVKWFSNKKGYGFVTPAEGSTISEDVFVHQSSIFCEGYRTLDEGWEVEFEIGHDNDGKVEAVSVTAPGGGPCFGPRKSRPNPRRRHGRAAHNTTQSELEEDLFRLVDQTIELDYQWNERLNELLEPGHDALDIELCASPPDYGVPYKSNEKLSEVDGNIDESFEDMVAVSSKIDSGICQRKKKRGRAEDESKGSRKRRRKDNDIMDGEEKQEIVVLGFAACNKCNMIFADADKALEHEGICNGETVHALADEIMSSLVDTSGRMAPANADNCNDLSLLTCMLGRKDRLGKRSVKITRKYAQAVSDGLL